MKTQATAKTDTNTSPQTQKSISTIKTQPTQARKQQASPRGVLPLGLLLYVRSFNPKSSYSLCYIAVRAIHSIATGYIVPTVTFRYLIPLRYRTVKIDTRQVAALVKRI